MVTAATAPPLLVSQDDDLAEEIARLAAAAGSDLRRRAEPTGAGGLWAESPLVLLDGRSAAAAATAGMPRAAPVLIVCRGDREPLWRTAFELGATAVLRLPEDEAALAELLADAVEAPAARSGRVVAVLGGSGGAGASTLAAAVAVSAAHRGGRAMLLDCDPLGGGLDLTVGVERSAGLRWSGLSIGGGRVAAGALREALPGRRLGAGSLTVLSCDRDGPSSGLTAPSVQAVIAAGRRAGDSVVCDLPRALSEATRAVLRSADLTVVLVPAQVRAAAAAARWVQVLGEHTAGEVGLVVRGPAPGGLRVRDVEQAVGARAIAVARTRPGLAAAVDKAGLCATRSATRGAVAEVAGEVLRALDERRAQERAS